MTERLGPLIIRTSRVMSDIITISVNYFLLLITFSLCILFASQIRRYDPASVNSSFKETLTEKNTEPTFVKIAVALFWEILNPGPDDTFSSNDGFSGHLIAMLYGIYQILTVMVLLNLLIALMNSTMQKIQDKKLLYWKFERAAIWMEFINADYYHTVPPPFYLIGNLFCCACFLLLCPLFTRKKFRNIWSTKKQRLRKYNSSSKRFSCKMSKEDQNRRRKHAVVMSNLVDRYLKDA